MLNTYIFRYLLSIIYSLDIDWRQKISARKKLIGFQRDQYMTTLPATTDATTATATATAKTPPTGRNIFRWLRSCFKKDTDTATASTPVRTYQHSAVVYSHNQRSWFHGAGIH